MTKKCQKETCGSCNTFEKIIRLQEEEKEVLKCEIEIKEERLILFRKKYKILQEEFSKVLNGKS